MMILAAPFGLRFGLPLIYPACCVFVSVGELLTITPTFGTSNCEYVFSDTPAPEGLVMLTCWRPFCVWITDGAFAPAPTT
ncbi:hypothetical protein VP95_04690 [Burkholderia pseudomallei]|nr:hypothetical protein VP95_04690 [Burkholderia pseudomallei]OND54028.1 hypothetical protein AQ937_23600 [Burkholderia pseudomallei]OND57528.1 hypothetical protein AQ936_17180 [Burkholderia pseudomallei]OND82523.1 hypothetical protein AQ940_29420 [Burkholderia pseudomallei]OND87304.1 hypothetical protein AQ939_15050 [Burkholderia pseudomallei]